MRATLQAEVTDYTDNEATHRSDMLSAAVSDLQAGHSGVIVAGDEDIVATLWEDLKAAAEGAGFAVSERSVLSITPDPQTDPETPPIFWEFCVCELPDGVPIGRKIHVDPTAWVARTQLILDNLPATT